MNLVQDSTINCLEELWDAIISKKENNEQVNKILLNHIGAKNNEFDKLKITLISTNKKIMMQSKNKTI